MTESLPAVTRNSTLDLRHSTLDTRNAIFVVGHKNPDTDAIGAAIGYAWLLNERDGANTIPARAGSVNAQTRFALETFKVLAPMLLEDASPRFEAITRHIEPLTPDTPLSAAWQLSAKTQRASPIVESDGDPVGLVTGQSVFEFLSSRLSETYIVFGKLINVPCGEACETDVPRFNARDRISDYRDSVIRSQRDDFWVVDGEGKYSGICTRADMMHPPRIKLVLVDHNEITQAVGGLLEAELLEVLDHHRLGTINTTMPIAFHVDTVGSCSTLVSERMRIARLTPPPEIAGMLLSGILSDTLVFKSPTTTPRDRGSAMWLAWHAFGVDDAEQKMAEYGEALLRAGADITNRSADDMVKADFKEFEAGPVKFGVSQVEVTNFVPILVRIEEIRSALRMVQEQRGLHFAGLMITDIVENNSVLACVGETRYYERLPFSKKMEGVWDMPGVVSRKKQLLPTILGMLQG
jgi:manganese-dependent inorganic pyrophosphatase